MTEAEWLACTDPTPMLKFLREKASDRKLRLFAVACCRRVWRLVNDKPISRKTLEFAERFADGLATRNELHGQAWGKAGSVFVVVQRKAWDAAEGSVQFGAGTVKGALLRLDTDLFKAWEDAFDGFWPKYHLGEAIQMADATMPAEWVAKGKSAWNDELRGQSHALREIFRNPFRCVTLDPTWIAPAAQALAQSIYDDRRFQDLPRIADALEVAGCTNADVLDHCRQPKEHVRGCWVLDLILGKD